MKKDENGLLYGQTTIVDLPTKMNGKHTDYYAKWNGMFRRCYSPKSLNNHPTYIGCSVSLEWHTLSTFKDWYYSQPNYGKSDIQLDKDILVKGNKIYGPLYCRLVPQRINLLLIDSRAARGAFPVGVYFHKASGKYKALCNDGTKKKYLGCFVDPDSAFTVYKNYKEQLIKYVADDYYSQNLIGTDIHNALINWTIIK